MFVSMFSFYFISYHIPGSVPRFRREFSKLSTLQALVVNGATARPIRCDGRSESGLRATLIQRLRADT